MKNLSVLLLVAWAGVSVPALAQKTIADGNTLDDYCRYARQRESGLKPSDAEFAKSTFCIGYIRGVLDEIWTQQNLPDDIGVKNVGRPKICISNEITNAQAVKVAVKYLQDNPAKLQLSANYLIRLSMEEAFPCKSP
jgi:hypothetical protein